jgi:Na+/proline symporter
MHALDYTILAVYLVGLLGIGFFLARKAGRSDGDYFLGGRNLPWWALGASGMSSNLDVAGTAAIVALIYHFGLHGFFIEMRGGVVLPIAVWLAFMGKWHRRSGVTTTGEWMKLRFGDGPGGAAARFATATTYLVITVGMVFFFLSAAGNFVAEFWPDTPSKVAVVQLEQSADELAEQAGVELGDDKAADAVRSAAVVPTAEQVDAAHQLAATQAELRPLRDERRSTEQWLAVAMATIALVYTAAAGLYGVVWTDVFQAFIIGTAAIYVSYVAYTLVTPDLLAAWPGSEFNTAYPQLYNKGFDLSETPGVNADYSLFGLFLLYFVGKGLLEGLGGSGGSAYMAQRFYAAKDDAATRRITMLWAVLFTFRWPMVLGLAIIAVQIGAGGDAIDTLLPAVLKSEYFPVGVRGLLIAALFAASMSTFDSTVNAGASYAVKDVFLPLFPFATPRQQVVVGYIASALIVGGGLALTLLFPAGVLQIWQTIVLLFSAFLVPFALRWFWPRFNGGGFTAGIVCGFGAFVVMRAAGWTDDFNEAMQFCIYAGSSLVGSVLVTYLTPGVDAGTRLAFYRSTKPLGPWEGNKLDRTEHRNDLARLVIALLWQISTFLLPMLVVLQMWQSVIYVGVPWLFFTVVLWRDARGTEGDLPRPAVASRA